MPEYPKQVEGLDLTAVDDGFVIYDTRRDRVHYLNPTAAVVLTLCDGRHSGEAIARLLQRQFGLAEPPNADVAQTVAQFVDEGLVTLNPATD